MQANFQGRHVKLNLKIMSVFEALKLKFANKDKFEDNSKSKIHFQ